MSPFAQGVGDTPASDSPFMDIAKESAAEFPETTTNFRVSGPLPLQIAVEREKTRKMVKEELMMDAARRKMEAADRDMNYRSLEEHTRRQQNILLGLRQQLQAQGDQVVKYHNKMAAIRHGLLATQAVDSLTSLARQYSNDPVATQAMLRRMKGGVAAFDKRMQASADMRIQATAAANSRLMDIPADMEGVGSAWAQILSESGVPTKDLDPFRESKSFRIPYSKEEIERRRTGAMGTFLPSREIETGRGGESFRVPIGEEYMVAPAGGGPVLHEGTPGYENWRTDQARKKVQGRNKELMVNMFNKYMLGGQATDKQLAALRAISGSDELTDKQRDEAIGALPAESMSLMHELGTYGAGKLRFMTTGGADTSLGALQEMYKAAGREADWEKEKGSYMFNEKALADVPGGGKKKVLRAFAQFCDKVGTEYDCPTTLDLSSHMSRTLGYVWGMTQDVGQYASIQEGLVDRAIFNIADATMAEILAGGDGLNYMSHWSASGAPGVAKYVEYLNKSGIVAEANEQIDKQRALSREFLKAAKEGRPIDVGSLPGTYSDGWEARVLDISQKALADFHKSPLYNQYQESQTLAANAEKYREAFGTLTHEVNRFKMTNGAEGISSDEVVNLMTDRESGQLYMLSSQDGTVARSGETLEEAVGPEFSTWLYDLGMFAGPVDRWASNQGYRQSVAAYGADDLEATSRLTTTGEARAEQADELMTETTADLSAAEARTKELAAKNLAAIRESMSRKEAEVSELIGDFHSASDPSIGTGGGIGPAAREQTEETMAQHKADRDAAKKKGSAAAGGGGGGGASYSLGESPEFKIQQRQAPRSPSTKMGSSQTQPPKLPQPAQGPLNIPQERRR